MEAACTCLTLLNSQMHDRYAIRWSMVSSLK